LAQDPGQVAALNNLADALNLEGCHAEALAVIERALAAAAGSEPLRGVLEQTRREILSGSVADASEPVGCDRSADDRDEAGGGKPVPRQRQ
jgi:hypothetical protein